MQLKEYANQPDLLVLGLPRGGVPVAFEVARALRASLDVFLVRKLGVPGHEELAMGAIASGGVHILNDMVVRGLNIDNEAINRGLYAVGLWYEDFSQTRDDEVVELLERSRKEWPLPSRVSAAWPSRAVPSLGAKLCPH
jgi:predicted phosphoribosyltransferase